MAAPATSFAEEMSCIARAVPQRQREFLTARSCARTALARLGAAPVAIGAGSDRAPVWPLGVVGSITHCHGYRGAAVAWSKDIAALGIDAEPNEPLPPNVAGLILSRAEQAQLASPQAANINLDRLIFSAKEAVFKAWWPLTSSELDFMDVGITIDAAHGTFSAALRASVRLRAEVQDLRFGGRWVVQDGLILTSVISRARAPIAV